MGDRSRMVIMTFKKILVGLDQSFKDSAVFARALEQAKPHFSSMMLVHTLKGDQRPNPMPAAEGNHDARDMSAMLSRMHQQRLDNEKQKAQEWLQMYFQQGISKGIPTQVDYRVISPALWLCELAQRWGADLIVIGHRDNHGIRSVGSDSVSQYVLQHSPCSVMIVHSLSQLESLNHIDREAPTKALKTPGSGILESQLYRV
jgi:nucleotide-binding universal stress UspA family protein